MLLARKLTKRKRHGKRGGRPQAELLTMQSDNMPAAIGPYTKGRLVKLPDGSCLAWSSGQLGLVPATNELLKPEGEGEKPVAAEARQVLRNLQALASDNGFDLERDTVKNVVYLTDMEDFATVNGVYKEFYKTSFPARTCIAIKTLPRGGLVEIESVFFKAGVPPCHA